jgi:predicted MFS family arabinose efflux permease
MGMGCGAVIGGSINDAIGWRWAFIMLAPISVLAGLGVNVFLPQSTTSDASLRQQLRRIDYCGSITLVSSLVLLLIYLNDEDSQAAAWGLSAKAGIPLAVALLALFVVVELRWAQEPIIHLTLFSKPTVLAACLSSAFMSMAVFTLMFYVPSYLQLRGYSTSETGVRLLPESVGGGLGSFMVGCVTSRTGQYSALKFIMPMLLVLASVGFAAICVDSSIVLPEIYLFFNGFGFGGLLTVLLLALLSAVPHSLQATSTSALLAFRSIGAAIGLSAAGTMFRSRLDHQSWRHAAKDQLVFPTTSHAELLEMRAQEDVDQLIKVYMGALRGTFQLALAFSIAGFICAFFVKSYTLRSTIKETPTANNPLDDVQEPGVV